MMAIIYKIIAKILHKNKISIPLVSSLSILENNKNLSVSQQFDSYSCDSCGCDCDYNCDWDFELEDLK